MTPYNFEHGWRIGARFLGVFKTLSLTFIYLFFNKFDEKLGNTIGDDWRSYQTQDWNIFIPQTKQNLRLIKT